MAVSWGLDRQPPDGSADEVGWVSADAAAQLLAVSQRTVFRMVDRGELETRGRYAHLNFSRESVEAAQRRGRAISLTVAARIMGRSTGFARDLIAAGELTSFANPKWPVFRLEVERRPVPTCSMRRPSGVTGG